MVYLITTVILIATVVAWFVWARNGASPFGSLQWISRVIVALPLVASGCMHFVRTGLFAAIIPPFFPYRLQLVWVSGVVELVGAVGLFLPAFTRATSTCLAMFMIAIFPANVYAANQTVGGLHMPAVPLRLVMQIIYILLLLTAGWGVPRRT
jgi:uncharacterized membrane protein